MQNIISLDTEELARRGFQHEGHPPHTHWRNTGGAGSPAPPGSRRLWTSQNTSQIGQESVLWNCVGERRGILAGSWDMCEPKSGGAETSFRPPLPGKWGGDHPPCPPCSYAYEQGEVTHTSACCFTSEREAIAYKWFGERFASFHAWSHKAPFVVWFPIYKERKGFFHRDSTAVHGWTAKDLDFWVGWSGLRWGFVLVFFVFKKTLILLPGSGILLKPQ